MVGAASHASRERRARAAGRSRLSWCWRARAIDAHAGDTISKGLYVGVDVGMSQLEPRNKDGGYKVDDSQSVGYRLDVGYSWSAAWSVELFYADGGEVGIAADNAAVGHLGDISYAWSAPAWSGCRWTVDVNAPWFPLIKIGAVQIRNHASSESIDLREAQ